MNRWELPEGWEWTTIGAVGEVRLGRQRTPEHHSGPNMRPYLRVANVHEGRIDTSDVKEMNFTDAEFEIFKLREGDVLLNEGQSKEFVGRPAIFKGEVPGACFQNTLVRFRASKDVNPEYAYQLFRHYMHAGHFQEIAKITTSIAHLGGDRFASRPFPLPPLQEQTRIAERLNALQARITTARAGLDELRQLATALKRSVLDAAFRGDLTATWRDAHPDTEPASALLDRLRAERRRRWQEAHPKKPYIAPEPVDPTDLPELPEGWCWAALEEVSDNHDGRRKPITAKDRVSGGYPYYGASGIVDQVDGYLFDGDYLLVSEDGANLLARSSPIAFRASGRFWVNNHAHVLTPASGVNIDFLTHAVEARDLMGSITGSAQPKLTQAALNRLPLPLPPTREQAVIASLVSSTWSTANQTLDAARALVEDLTTTEHALLTAAFRGELSGDLDALDGAPQPGSLVAR